MTQQIHEYTLEIKYYFGKLIKFHLLWWLNGFQTVPVQILFLCFSNKQ